MSRIERMMRDGLSISDLVAFHLKCQDLHRSWLNEHGYAFGPPYDENTMRFSFVVPPYGARDKDPIFYMRNMVSNKEYDGQENEKPTSSEDIVVDAFSHLLIGIDDQSVQSNDEKFDFIMEHCQPKHRLLDEITESNVYKEIFSSASPIADKLIHMHLHAGGHVLEKHQHKPWVSAYYSAFRVFVFSTIAYFLIRYMDESNPNDLKTEVENLKWKISNLVGVEKQCVGLAAALSAGVIDLDDGLIQRLDSTKSAANEKRMEIQEQLSSMSMRLEKFDVRNPETAFLRRMAEAFIRSSRDKSNYTRFIRPIFEAYIDDYDSDRIKQVIKDHKKGARLPVDIMGISVELTEDELAQILVDWQAE